MRLQASGKLESLEAVAIEAQVSRATVYRYFSSVGDLRSELALSIQIRDPLEVLALAGSDPLSRVLSVHAHLFDLVSRHESEFRAYLKRSMEEWERRNVSDETPIREGRRALLLDAAIENLRDTLGDEEYRKLIQALSLVVFIEPFILLKDIFGLSDAEADESIRWTIEHLLRGVLSKYTS